MKLCTTSSAACIRDQSCRTLEKWARVAARNQPGPAAHSTTRQVRRRGEKRGRGQGTSTADLSTDGSPRCKDAFNRVGRALEPKGNSMGRRDDHQGVQTIPAIRFQCPTGRARLLTWPVSVFLPRGCRRVSHLRRGHLRAVEAVALNRGSATFTVSWAETIIWHCQNRFDMNVHILPIPRLLEQNNIGK